MFWMLDEAVGSLGKGWCTWAVRYFPQLGKLQTHDEVEILCVFVESDFDIYIIGSPLMHVPTYMMNAWTWTELQAGEFPKMRNFS
jgi:hypothetical protein